MDSVVAMEWYRSEQTRRVAELPKPETLMGAIQRCGE